jgi:hypothetical protein
MAINLPSAPSMFESVREWELYVSRLETLSASNEQTRAAVDFALKMARELIETKKSLVPAPLRQYDEGKDTSARMVSHRFA